MSDDILLPLGAALLIGCGMALIPAAALAISELKLAYAQRSHARAEAQELAQAQEDAISQDLLRNELMSMEMEFLNPEPKPNYRHNLHCPACGRFAARVVEGSDTVVMCRRHDLQVRWKDIPVDWASTPATICEEGVTLVITPADEMILAHTEITDPVFVIPDDLSMLQLEEAGAVL